MEVVAVFNNNVVLAKDSDGREVVVTGRGLGYQGRRGDIVDQAKVQQVFVPDAGHNVGQLAVFLSDIPPEHLTLAAEALQQAEAVLEVTFTQGMVIPLADHISFAIKRVRQGITVGYPLRAEVTHLYPNELRAARQAVAMVSERTGVELHPDEAIPIALHFVNAMFATDDLSRTFQMTAVFAQAFEVLTAAYGREFDTEGINAARFITHLRYFFVRVESSRQLTDTPDSFVNAIRESFPKAHLCADRMKALLELRLGKPITPDEVIYLTLHIERLATESLRPGQ